MKKREVSWHKTYRYRALQEALLFVGVKEHPAGSNRGPVVVRRGFVGGIDEWCRRAAGVLGYPWCAAFVCAMFSDQGMPIPEPRRASVGYLEQWAAKVGELVNLKKDRPKRGDLICYRFDSDDWPDHIGIIDKVRGIRWAGRRFVGYVKTVEGNTSAGNDANGGQVQIRYRWCSGREKFIRIPGPFVAAS